MVQQVLYGCQARQHFLKGTVGNADAKGCRSKKGSVAEIALGENQLKPSDTHSFPEGLLRTFNILNFPFGMVGTN